MKLSIGLMYFYEAITLKRMVTTSYTKPQKNYTR